MPITISKLTDQGFLVNGKAVYQDLGGVWKPETKLEYFELHAFKQHLKSIYPDGNNIVNN